MKIMLFSDQNCLEAEKVGNRLIDLVGKQEISLGYISSCPDASRKFYSDRKQYYGNLNVFLTPYLDLEEGFNLNNTELIFQADAIHLSGGNTYRFLYWIIKRGLKQRLIQYVKSGGVLIGVSAGSIIMTPDIDTSVFCGDENQIGLKDSNGLSLIDFHFVPHAISGQSLAKDIIIKSKQDNSAIVVNSDQDWIVIEDNKFEVYGQPQLVLNGDVVNMSYINFIFPQKRYEVIKK